MEGEGEAERRRHPRVQARIYRVKFKVLRQPPSPTPESYYEGEALNVSRGGMCFRAQHPVKVGEQIHYFIDSPSGHSGREGTARVVRVHEEPDGLIVAVEFLT